MKLALSIRHCPPPITKLIAWSLLLTGLCTTSTTISANKLFKWVDENGQIRYSDRLPAYQSSERFQTLAPDGRVLDTREKAKTPEQIRLERAEKKRLEAEASKIATQKAKILSVKKHHDDVLMLTYTSETEILEARNERIEVIDSVLKILNKEKTIEEEHLKEQQIRAQKNFIDKNQKVPGGLAQNIEYSTAKIQSKQDLMDIKKTERDKLIFQYEEDINRYRELSELKQRRADNQ